MQLVHSGWELRPDGEQARSGYETGWDPVIASYALRQAAAAGLPGGQAWGGIGFAIAVRITGRAAIRPSGPRGHPAIHRPTRPRSPGSPPGHPRGNARAWPLVVLHNDLLASPVKAVP